MADMYYRLIKEGRRTIDQVPDKFRSEAQALLNADV